MAKIKFYLTKRGKKLVFDHQRDFLAWQASLEEGEAVAADFYIVKDARQDKHNRLWWKCIDRFTKLFNDVDLTKEKVHDWAKYTFLGHEESILGADIFIIPSTAELSAEELVEAVERMNNWAFEKFGEPLLDPHWNTIKNELKNKK